MSHNSKYPRITDLQKSCNKLTDDSNNSDSRVQSKLRRTLLGGLTFLTVKGVIKIYHKQHVFVRQGQRKIMDYNEMPSPANAAAATEASTQTNQNNGSRRQ